METTFPSWVLEDSDKQRYITDSTCPDYRQFATLGAISHYSCLLPFHTSDVADALHQFFSFLPEPVLIIDATAHIGADTIHFHNVFPYARIVAIEQDEAAFNCLRKNIQTMCAKKQSMITPIHGDVCDLLGNLPNHPSLQTLLHYTHYQYPTMLYIDCPWGGPDYKDSNILLSLKLSEKTLVQDFILKLIEQSRVNEAEKLVVVVKVPLNFDKTSFMNCFTTNPRVYSHLYKIIHRKSNEPSYALLALYIK